VIDDDQLLSLAFSLASNPAGYALLIGAGVSKGAGLPSAWDVLEDLTAKAARLKGAEPENPTRWWEQTYGARATYEDVLERLAPSQDERQALLRGYFEPTPMVEPSIAHRGIAELVKSGTVRVIITLNFDRLVETAVRDAGIEPVVIANEADVAGMPPLHTIRCCVIHLHGDYLSPLSMLNTTTELAKYDRRHTKLLKRVLGDYGLIAAGWSANYDPALRNAIAEYSSGRFTFTWVEPGEQTEEARRLLELKHGQLVTTSADDAFGRLADAVASVQTRRARHPLTLPTAIETAKRELAGRSLRVSLHDTVANEFRLLHELEDIRNPTGASNDAYDVVVQRIDEASTVVSGLLATLAFWGDASTDKWWLGELRRFAVRGEGGGYTRLLDRRLIAGSSMFYAAGIAAVASERFDLLLRLLSTTREARYGGTEPFARDFGADRFQPEARPDLLRPYPIVEPILAQVFGTSSERLDEWWQQFEVIRFTYLTMRDRFFDQSYQSHSQVAGQIVAENRTLERLRKQNDTQAAEASAALIEQLKAESSETFKVITASADVGRSHVRTVNSSLGREFAAPVAEQLAWDVEADGRSHPLLRAGFADGPGELVAALRAVSAKLGEIGSELSWASLPPGGGALSDVIWLDDLSGLS
jgi:hypothetical protein